MFRATLGLALSHWAQVESLMCLICFSCFDSKHHPQIRTGFFSIENFRSKLAFMDSIVRPACYEVGIEDKWDLVRIRAESLSTKRNQLAHRPTYFFPTQVVGRRFALVENIPQKFVTKPRSGKAARHPPGSLCLKDIELIRHDFLDLSTELERLYVALFSPDKQPPESDASLDAKIRHVTAETIISRMLSGVR